MITDYIPYVQNVLHKYRARKVEPEFEEPLWIGSTTETESIFKINSQKKPIAKDLYSSRSKN